MNATRPRPGLTVRHFDVSRVELPRFWFGGSALLTHATDALGLLFPKGERFFVRSVRHYADRITDPVLRAQVDDFIKQEAQHGAAHQATFVWLTDQGYEIDDFLAWFDRWAFQRIERWSPPSLRLATTAALEHLTATLGTRALELPYLAEAPACVRDLLRWHAAEEIEHKAVAFDVFELVDGRYLVRITGMGVALGTFFFFWSAGIRHLVRQDPDVDQARLDRERDEARARGQDRDLRAAVLRYLRPGFHPDDEDNRELARDYLASVGRLDG